MKISIIAAIGKNNELGKNNTLLWSMPADMKHFREITAGHAVIMGRKTFESIGHPLPNRQNIVITRDEDYRAEGIKIVHSLEDALKVSRTSPNALYYQGEGAKNSEEVFIIGGAEIYKQAMQFADKLYITHVEAEDKEADTFFPEIDSRLWKEVSRETHQPDEKNLFSYSFIEYIK